MRKATIFDFARICKTYQDECVRCPLNICNNKESLVCLEMVIGTPEKANEIIMKWCDEHPVKTYYDDLREKFPNCNCPEDAVVCMCRKVLYNGLRIGHECDNIRECKDCWNEPMEESE